MIDIIEFTEEFFKSEYVQDNIVAIISMLVISFLLGAVIVWLYMTKIYMKCVLNDRRDLEKENKVLCDNVEQLQTELNEVKANRDMLLSKSKELAFFDSLDKAKKAQNDIDPALELFIRKDK